MKIYIKINSLKKGFTLLEILLVVVVIGILATIVLVAINPNRQLAQIRNTERRIEVDSIYKALEQYLIDTGSYPVGITSSLKNICNTGSEQVGGSTDCNNQVDLRLLVPNYLTNIPIDPRGSSYMVSINSNNFKVIVYTNAELGQKISINNNIWFPSDLGSNLKLWLDASDQLTINTVGSNVSEWRDKSLNAFHLSQSTSGDRPLFVANQLNGNPIIRNVSGDFLSRNNVPILKNVSQGWMIVVSKYPTSANNGGNGMLLFVNSGGLSQTRMGLTAFPGSSIPNNNLAVTGRRLDNDAFGSVSSSTTRASIENKWTIEIGNLNYANAQANHWTNGVQDLAGGVFQTAGITSNSNALLISILSGAVTPSPLVSPNNTEIAEALILENDLSILDRQRIEGYLAWKWGLVNNLPNDHPYKNSQPTL